MLLAFQKEPPSLALWLVLQHYYKERYCMEMYTICLSSKKESEWSTGQRHRIQLGCSMSLHTCGVQCCPALLCSPLFGEPRQIQKQLCGGYWTGSVAASEIIKENFIADEPSDRTCLVPIRGRRKGFNHSSKMQICQSLWLHSGSKEMLLWAQSLPYIPYNSGYVWFLPASEGQTWELSEQWRLPPCCLVRDFLSFSAGILPQFLKQ